MAKIKKLLAAVAIAALLPATAAPALSAGGLPKPYVSRALDAVLIPVDDSVRSAFSLGRDDKGVLVLAVQPNGVADASGLNPGDIISRVESRAIASPIDVDEIVYYFLKQGRTGFSLGALSGGKPVQGVMQITEAQYEEVLEITTVSTWESYSSSSFSYSEYTSEYSQEISESYSSSESLIAETASSAEFAQEQTAAETDPDVMDTDNDGTPDAMDNDDDGDGVEDGSDTDPGADDNANDVGPDDGGGDDAGGDDGGADEPVE